jgi:serine/threonine-protein kinase
VLFAHAIIGSSRANNRRYEPIAQIGRGGMAEVLLAMMDSGAGARRLAVLKRIGPELATDPDFVTMFLDEARLSLRLSHANVVQTYEVLVGDDELAIAMEYLDGQPLTRVLNRLLRGPGEQLGLPLRLRILTRVLAGLQHAHMLADLDGTPLGVVHRDVSPQNVFVTYDGQVKLVDFGVAKTIAASHQTRPGAIKGKLAYMAPEQLQSEAVDRRADLFSVGVMLWEMLAQRRMWHRMTEVEIVGHLASGRPMPALPVLPADVPTELDAICMRALEMDPALRYQTAEEMEMDLERVLVGAADSHARNLGTVVSLAFAAERAERQAVIERCLRRSVDQAAPASLEPDALPTIDVPREGLDEERTPPRAAAAVDDPRPSDATPVLRVNPSLSAPSGVAASPIDPQASYPRPMPQARSAAHRALRVWRAAAVAGMLATVAALSLALAWRRAPAARAVPNVAAGAAAPLPAAAPTAPARDPEPRSQSPRAVGAAGRDETERPHRHRRPKHTDEDAVMPPTGIDDES